MVDKSGQPMDKLHKSNFIHSLHETLKYTLEYLLI